MSLKHLELFYGKEAANKIVNSNVLVIGVGGIGCETLKNLVRAGYKKISILDLDTIEITNLNRQFYFRKKHVGKSKALIACESVKE